MSDSDERLAYMANQIARNFMAQGVDKAIAATADHIASFWDPRMRSQALALRARDPAAFSPEALAALDRLAARA